MNEGRKAENAKRAEENVQRAAANVQPLPLLPVLSMGSGINTGDAVVGEMGSAEQTNYTVFGREVNLASRLEGVSGHGRIIIGEATYLDLKQSEPDSGGNVCGIAAEGSKRVSDGGQNL